MSERSGTFVVTAVDDESAVLRDVETAQLHTLSTHPGLDQREVLRATLSPEPPLEVVWTIEELSDRRTVEVIDSELSPTTHSLETAAELATGEVRTVERAGRGEIHLLSVPPADVEAAATDVVDDVETVARAARLDAVRVEVRSDAEAGLVSVRYLPD